jgi:threo-3-hydroxy-L-aspartate ammonia-lyase
VELYLKAELFQKTGSFKPRGALNRIRHTPDDDLARGLIGVSAGNHAQGLAWAARAVGAGCTVVMPETAPASKVEATRGYGAEVVLHATVAEIFEKMEEIRRERDLVLVHPFDDPYVVAGQGTVGLEILDDAPDIDAVLVPVSGGGLISGIAVAVRSRRPDLPVIGVEPELAADARDSLRAGYRIAWSADVVAGTIADALRVERLGELTFSHISKYVDDIVTVSEDEIRAAMRRLVRDARLVAEPGGAVTTAAYLFHGDRLPPARTCAAVLSGGNVDPALLAATLTE